MAAMARSSLVIVRNSTISMAKRIQKAGAKIAAGALNGILVPPQSGGLRPNICCRKRPAPIDAVLGRGFPATGLIKAACQPEKHLRKCSNQGY
jgi:hypothetical protein